MYEALVLICLMGAIENGCVEAQDTRGPYQTKQECIARTQEMTRDLNKANTPFLPVAARCNKTGSQI